MSGKIQRRFRQIIVDSGVFSAPCKSSSCVVQSRPLSKSEGVPAIQPAAHAKISILLVCIVGHSYLRNQILSAEWPLVTCLGNSWFFPLDSAKQAQREREQVIDKRGQ